MRGRCDYCHRDEMEVEKEDEIDGEPVFLCVDAGSCSLATERKRLGIKAKE